MKQIIITIFFFLAVTMHAQPGTPIDGPPVPIDGGILALLAAGAAYGIKKHGSFNNKQ